MTKSESGKWRIVYNNDGSPHVFLHPFPMTYEQLISHVDPLAGLIDVFVYQMFSGNVFLHDTRVGEFYTGPYTRKGEFGMPAGVGPFDVTKNARRLIDQGLDPMRVLCERARQKGIKFLAGLRMNDVHDLWLKEWTCRAKKEHPEWLIGKEGKDPEPSTAEWNSFSQDPRPMAWNFAEPAVIKMRLDLLQETIEKYDLDGLELDFNRYPLLFPPGDEAQHAHLLTELMDNVRRMLDEKGKRAGRPLELGVIIPYSPAICEETGIRIHDWIAQGLLNYIAPREIDLFLTETPFEEWRQLLRGTETQLLASAFENAKLADDIYYALASRGRQAGADGMHLFNFNYRHPPESETAAKLLQVLRDPQATARHDKHYILASRKHTIGSYTGRFDVPCYLGDETSIAFFLGDDLSSRPDRPAPDNIGIQLYLQGHIPELAFSVNDKQIPSFSIRCHEEERDFAKIGCWWVKPQKVTVADIDVTGLPLSAGKNRFIVRRLDRNSGAGEKTVVRYFGVYVKYPQENGNAHGRGD